MTRQYQSISINDTYHLSCDALCVLLSRHRKTTPWNCTSSPFDPQSHHLEGSALGGTAPRRSPARNVTSQNQIDVKGFDWVSILIYFRSEFVFWVTFSYFFQCFFSSWICWPSPRRVKTCTSWLRRCKAAANSVTCGATPPTAMECKDSQENMAMRMLRKLGVRPVCPVSHRRSQKPTLPLTQSDARPSFNFE